MAVGVVHLFNNGPLRLMNGASTTGKGWNATTGEAGLLHGLLLTATTAPVDTNNVWSDISANQVSGTGYTAGGIALAGQAVAVASSNYRFDSDIWGPASGSTITAKWFIVAQRGAASGLIVAGDFLIFYVNLDIADTTTTSVQSNNGAFQVDAASSTGWFQIPFQTGEGS